MSIREYKHSAVSVLEPRLTALNWFLDSAHLFVVDTIEGLVLCASGERGVSLALI